MYGRLCQNLCENATNALGHLRLRPLISSTMLPRHLRRAVLTPAAPAQIRALLLTRQSLRPLPLALHPAYPAGALSASFHSSARRQNNEPPKSPFQTFVDVLKDELRKNRELQDNVKQLQGDVEKFQDSEAMKRAREAYERARASHMDYAESYTSVSNSCLCSVDVQHQRESSTKGRGRGASESWHQGRRRCGRGVENHGGERACSCGTCVYICFLYESSRAFDRQISRASAAVSSTIERTTEPIRNTAAYKTLSETISDALDDSGSAKHAGFEEKEARRKRRQIRLEKAGRNSIGVRTKANPEYVIPCTDCQCH